ncbi:MAG: RDD family protein [Pseudonocardiaceae bacterium]
MLAATEPAAALNPADPLGKSGQRSGRPTRPFPQLAPPPQFGRAPRFAPPPQFGRRPLSARQQAYYQADPGSPHNGAQPALEAPSLETAELEGTELESTEQQRDSGAPFGQSDADVPATKQAPAPLADFGARAISFLIDYVTPVIVLKILLAIGVATGNGVLSSLTVAGYLGLGAFGLWNSGYLQGTTGQSVGRRVARTALVTIETRQPIGSGKALLRLFCHSLEFVIGYLWPLWDDKRQTFADKIVGTVVIRVEGAAEDRSASSPP